MTHCIQDLALAHDIPVARISRACNPSPTTAAELRDAAGTFLLSSSGSRPSRLPLYRLLAM